MRERERDFTGKMRAAKCKLHFGKETPELAFSGDLVYQFLSQVQQQSDKTGTLVHGMSRTENKFG